MKWASVPDKKMRIKQLCNRSRVCYPIWLYGTEKFLGLSRNGPLPFPIPYPTLLPRLWRQIYPSNKCSVLKKASTLFYVNASVSDDSTQVKRTEQWLFPHSSSFFLYSRLKQDRDLFLFTSSVLLHFLACFVKVKSKIMAFFLTLTLPPPLRVTYRFHSV